MKPKTIEITTTEWHKQHLASLETILHHIDNHPINKVIEVINMCIELHKKERGEVS